MKKERIIMNPKDWMVLVFLSSIFGLLMLFNYYFFADSIVGERLLFHSLIWSMLSQGLLFQVIAEYKKVIK